jgi:transmembrane sensor
LVLEELKRQYSIKLTAKFNGTDQRFTGSFTHSDLNLALKSICNPLHLEYTIEEESVTIYAKEGQ